MTRFIVRLTLFTLFTGLILAGLAVVAGQVWPGDVLAFVSDRDDQQEIYLIDLDRGLLHNLTRHRFMDALPAWTPDGEKLAFLSWRGGGNLYCMDSTGRNLELLGENITTYSPLAWSPDGESFAMVTVAPDTMYFGLNIMDRGGSFVRRITGQAGATPYSPAWSPDGRRIAFSYLEDDHSGLRLIDVATGDEQRYDSLTSWVGAPSWSPDGNRLTFMRIEQGAGDIYVMDVDGGNLHNLTHHPAWDDTPAWSPDGQRIAFVSSREGSSDIYVMDVDGGNLRRVTTHPGQDTRPVWQPY